MAEVMARLGLLLTVKAQFEDTARRPGRPQSREV